MSASFGLPASASGLQTASPSYFSNNPSWGATAPAFQTQSPTLLGTAYLDNPEMQALQRQQHVQQLHQRRMQQQASGASETNTGAQNSFINAFMSLMMLLLSFITKAFQQGGQLSNQLGSGYPSSASSSSSASPFQLNSSTTGTANNARSQASASPVVSGQNSGPSQYDAMILEAVQQHGQGLVKPSLVKALIQQESNFDPNAKSSAGAGGLTQFLAGTAQGLGYSAADRFDPKKSIEMSVKYLVENLRRYNGDETKALAAYNAGPGNVDNGRWTGFSETRNYVQKITGNRQNFAGLDAALQSA
ncbi:MAG: lytic transglycosylase domain-containing protein [Candidatus Melainabacteria bacterium]|nr:lytic transglycosylase domain-containing protein [Candidatus Melainabacteria bacterium]